MSTKTPSPISAQRAKDMEQRAQDGKKAMAEAVKLVGDRDANTARLKALRLERDRQEALNAPEPKPAKAAKRKS